MIFCAIYSRYSSENQNERSITDQVRNCRQLAVSNSWVVSDSHLYSDRAVSGKTIAQRAGLQQLLKDAAARKRPFGCVLVDDTSRLSRDKVEQQQIVRELQDYGIFIYFVSDGIDTRDEMTQDVLLPVYGIKDSLYCRDLAKKTKRGMTGQVLNGYNPGGKTYGYKYFRVPDPSGVIDKKTQQVRSLGTRIEIDPMTSPVVRRIFEMYADGRGLKAIASTLTNESVPPPGASLQKKYGSVHPSWCPNAIRAMLRNPKYSGDWTWNKTSSLRRIKTGRRTYSPRAKEEWVPYIDASLAIVDAQLWDRVQARVARSARTYQMGDRASRRKYLLSGLLRCGLCGANLIVSKISTSGEITYRCSRNWQRGAKACNNSVAISGTVAEERVIAALRCLLRSKGMLGIVIDEANKILREESSRCANNGSELLTTRNKVVREIERLITLVSGSDVDMPSVRTAIQNKERELADVESRIQTKRMSGPEKALKITDAEISAWLEKLSVLIRTDIETARYHLKEIIGPLEGTPGIENGREGLLFTGKPMIEGVLGMFGGVSNLNNGGGRI